MEDPIEDVMLPSTSLPIYSFANTEFATLYGFEIDGRKNFDLIYIQNGLTIIYPVTSLITFQR